MKIEDLVAERCTRCRQYNDQALENCALGYATPSDHAELALVILDGKDAVKLKCPLCGTWGYLDKEQVHGRVSVICGAECGYHETQDFSRFLPRRR